MANLKLKLLAESCVGYAEGDAVSSWPDASGLSRTFTTGAGNAPRFMGSGLNGLPSCRFDGGNDWCRHQSGATVSLNDYLNASAPYKYAFVIVCRPFTIATNNANIWQNAAIFADHDETYTGGACGEGDYIGLHLKSGGGSPTATLYHWDGAVKTAAVAIALGDTLVLDGYYDGTNISLRANKGTPATAAASALSIMPLNEGTDLNNLIAGSAHGAGYWFDGDLAELWWWDEKPTDLDDVVDALLLKYGVAAVAATEEARARASRELRLWRRPLQRPRIFVPPARGLDIRPGERVTVTHPALPGGSGTDPWARWLGRVYRKTIRPDFTVELELVDARPLTYRLWYVAYNTVSSGLDQNGPARVLSGQTWTMSRGGPALVEDPGARFAVYESNIRAGGSASAGVAGFVVPVAANAPKLDAAGHLLEGASTNLLLNSAFADWSGGPTSWTTSGTVTEETADVLLRSEVSERAAGIAAAGYVQQTTGTVSASSPLTLSFDTKAENVLSGGRPRYSLKKTQGGKDYYWDASIPGWGPDGGAEVNNAVDVPGVVWYRHVVALGNIGGSTATFTLRLKAPAATYGAKFALAQIEAKNWASSRILTRGSATQARVADALSVTNNAAARVWPATAGAAKATVVPHADSAALASTDDLTVLYAYHDASNWARLWYDASAAAWTFTVKAAGIEYSATKTATLTRGTAVSLAVRWTSADGEWDTSPHTLSIWVDGVKGTDAVAAVALTEAATSTLYLGHKNGTEYLEGALRALLIQPLVLDDGDCARED